MNKKYFAVIVGAGPAGSYLAYKLARNNKPVALLDKKTFPRYKTCGGGISAKAAKLLIDAEIDFSSLVQDRINKIIFTKNCLSPVPVSFEQPIIEMVMRDEFDDYLRQCAVSAGVDFYPECTFLQQANSKKGLLIKTSGKTINTIYLVGADGANSQVAKSMGQPVKRRKGFAVECELESTRHGQYKGTVILDHGHIDDGYGWIFPKKNHLSVGIGSFSPKQRNYRHHLESFLTSLNLPHEKILTRGHLIPTPLQKKVLLHKDFALLVGDAAGLADPMTGEGIYYALKSAELAAEELMKNKISSYSDAVNSQLMPELRQAKRVAKILYTAPATVHGLIQKNHNLAKNLAEVVYGGESYRTLFKGLASQIVKIPWANMSHN